MTLKRVSIVIDYSLWDPDDIEKQTNAVVQGLMNSKGRPDEYPIVFRDYEGNVVDIASQRCDDCSYSARCRELLGPSYKENGPCDWIPSRFESSTKWTCVICGYENTVDERCTKCGFLRRLP